MQPKRLRKPTNYDEEIDSVIKSVEKNQQRRKLRKASSSMEIESESESEESDGNESICWKCKNKTGELLCCDSCVRSYHLTCLNIKKPPKEQWYCPQCSQYEESKCPYCKKSSLGSQIICSRCNTFIHLDCLSVPIEGVLKSPVNKKYVTEENLEKNLAEKSQLIFHCCERCFECFGVGQILNHLKIDDKFIYLIQLEGSSYIHCHYLTEQSVQAVNSRKLKNYKDKYQSDCEEEMQVFNEEDVFEYLEPERIISCKKGSIYFKKSWNEIYADVDSIKVTRYGCKSNFKFFVKWSRLFYEDSTWEDAYFILNLYKDEFKRFLRIKMFEDTHGTLQFDELNRNFLKQSAQQPLAGRDKNQPSYINAGVLHNFQLQGLDWLKKSFQQNNNVILADEMGLGKTIQTIAFLRTLQYEHNNNGPFLVIGPATILYNWLKELKKWANNFNVIVYTGNQESRDLIKQKEFYYQGKQVCKFNVLITSYDMAINDQSVIRKIKWKCLVVDEAHRLKNNDSRFFKVCSSFSCSHIILLTGTPLQNNILELINLIEFIAPAKAKHLKNKDSLSLLFNSSQEQQLSEEMKKATLQELNELLKPHILRRTKADVKLQIPEMEEIIVKLCLTDTQKFLYKNVLLRNYDKLKVLDQKTKGSNKANLLNILMSLRLVCNHPLLFTHKRDFQVENVQELIQQSNKLKFIDRVLPRLLEMHHKMLIFSQFTMMLDLLQYYLNLKSWSYERLDGNTGIMDRQKIIDSFNNSTSKSRIFLLSTRAGGLGINLTAADTIIFTDSDFNPYRDLQAISRAHRMGQMNKVKVYRLVSKHTAEERIIDIATKKLLLEEIIINPINKFTKDDFTSIFKESTWELFNKNLEEQDQEFTDDQLNILLSRGNPEELDGNKNFNLVKNNLNDYYLSGFKFTSLNFETVQQQDQQEIQKDKLDKYWETLLDSEAKNFAEQEMNEFGKGKRVKRTNIPNYSEELSNKLYKKVLSSNPSEYSPSNQNQISESDENQNEQGEENMRKKDLKVPSERMQKLQDKDQQIVRFFQQKVLDQSELNQYKNLTTSEDQDLVINGMSAVHRIEFLEFILQFGMEFENIDAFYNLLLKEKPTSFNQEYRPSNDEFKKYVKEFYAVLLDFDNPNNQRNVAFCGINPKNLFYRVCGLVCLKRKYLFYQKRPEKFNIKHSDYHRIKIKKGQDERLIYQGDRWTNYDDFHLSKGVIEKGFGSYQQILYDQYIPVQQEQNDLPYWYLVLKKIDPVPYESIVDVAKAQRYLYSPKQVCGILVGIKNNSVNELFIRDRRLIVIQLILNFIIIMQNSSVRQNSSSRYDLPTQSEFRSVRSNTPQQRSQIQVSELHSSRVTEIRQTSRIDPVNRVSQFTPPIIMFFMAAEIERLRNENEKQANKIKDLNDQIFNTTHYQKQIQDLTDRVKELEGREQVFIYEKEQIISRTSTLQQDVSYWKEKFTDLDRNVVANLESENQVLLQELETLRLRLRAFEDQRIKDLQVQRDQLEYDHKLQMDKYKLELDSNIRYQREFLEAELKKWKDQATLKQKENDQLQQLLQQKEQQNQKTRDLENQLAQFRADNDRLNKSLTVKQEETQTWKQKYMTLQQIKEQYDRLEEEYDHLNQNYQNLESQYNNLLQTQGQYNSEIEKLRSVLKNKQEENDELKAKLYRQEKLVSDYLIEKKQLIEKLNFADQEIERLQFILRQKQSELDSAIQTLKDQDYQLRLYQSDISRLQDAEQQLKASELKQRELEQRYKNVLRDLDQAKNENQQRDLIIIQQNQEISSYETQITSYNQQIDDRTEEIEELQRKVKELQYQISQLLKYEENIRVLSQEIDRLNGQLRGQEDELKQWRLQYSSEGSLIKKIQDQLCTIVILISEVESLRMRLFEKEAEIDEVRKSTLAPFKMS